MPFLVRCPHCGPREATEYVYGGEVVARPEERIDLRLASKTKPKGCLMRSDFR